MKFIKILFLLIFAQMWAQSERTISVNPFSRLEIAGSYEVIMDTSLSKQLIISGSEDMINQVKIIQIGDKLSIGTERKLKVKKKYNQDNIQIRIPYSQLTELVQNGSGRFLADQNIANSEKLSLTKSGSGQLDIKVNTINLITSLSGSGIISLDGEAVDFDLTMSGSGMFKGEQFRSKLANIKLSGSGLVDIKKADILKLMMSGSGVINCQEKSESISQSISGSGQINCVKN